ncbi:MAG: TPM domain-containing protein [Prolixibacteraceae bacterium]
MNKLALVVISVLGFTALFAQIPDRPSPPRLVNDFAGILSPEQEYDLEKSLVPFARETSTQIVVVTVEDLAEFEPWDYAVRLGEKWGVGQSENDNGLVILIKPKMEENDRGHVHIATGYGLEGVLPDAVVNGAIIDNEMIPYFRQGEYYRGLAGGINVIMDITRGEYTAEYYQQNYSQEKGGILPVLIVFIIFFVVFPILRFRRSRYYSPGKSLPFWLALGLLSGSGRSHGGSFSNFSSGGGSFGRGGGFGGFGGGSFGGGGAGGSW